MVYFYLALAFFGAVFIFEQDNNIYKVAYIFFVGLSPFTYLASLRLVDWLYTRRDIPLIELKAEEDSLSLWGLTPSQFQDLSVKGKYEELASRKCAGGFGEIFICRTFDPNNLSATGTYKAGKDDLKLLEREEEIEDLKTRYKEEVKKARLVRSSYSANIRKAKNQILAKIISTLEKSTLYKGKEINKVIEEKEDTLTTGLTEEEKEEEQEEENDVVGLLDQLQIKNNGSGVEDDNE